ncbi:MAG TPA: response regulator [Rhizomicrobium sp.]|jgi:CheY-like chemotaxis protein|nr:response regulator [Rhizomicrobium sp.]
MSVIQLNKRRPAPRTSRVSENGSCGAELPGRSSVAHRGPARRCAPRDPAFREAATILVADSNLISGDGVAQLLANQGYKVIRASNGLEALALIQRGGIDLLVSAMIMRSMDGLELLRALRDLGIELPAIAISRGSEAIDEIYLKGATLLGAARTCLQPMRSSAFLGHVRDLLNSADE